MWRAHAASFQRPATAKAVRSRGRRPFAQNANRLRVVENELAPAALHTFQELSNRRCSAAARAKTVGHDDGAATALLVALDQFARHGSVVMRETAHKNIPRRSFDAPCRNRISACVHVNSHLLACEKAEQVPEQMQRGRKQRCPLAA